jgi:hypothetical protein
LFVVVLRLPPLPNKNFITLPIIESPIISIAMIKRNINPNI